jgi:hypothetical protein
METDLSRREGLRKLVTLSLVGTAVAASAAAFSEMPAAASGQPHMDAALADLQAALHQLQIAAHDKGGHRAKAIDLVKQAISETTVGIAAGAV